MSLFDNVTSVRVQEDTPQSPSLFDGVTSVRQRDEDEYEPDLVLPENFSVSALAGSDDYMTKVRAYMGNRLGEGGKQKDGEENKDYIERFLSHMRSFENNTIDLTQEMSYIYGANDQERKQFAEAYDIYNSLPGMFSRGGGSVLSGLYDYTTLNVFDPANIVGVGVGTLAAKQFAKQGVKGVLKGLAKRGNRYFNAGTVAGAAADGVVSAGMDAGLQNVLINSGIQDEYSAGRTAAAFGLGAAGSQAAQSGIAAIGSGVRSISNKARTGEFSSAGRNLQDEIEAARGDVTKAEVTAQKKKAEVAEFEYDKARKLLDDIVETKYFDDAVDPLPATREKPGETSVTEGFSPELSLRATEVITDVVEKIAQETGRPLPGGPEKQLSDKIFDVLQIESDNITDPTKLNFADINIMERVISEAGLTPLEFAQIFRVTVSDAGRQLQQLSALSRRLSEIGGLTKGQSDRIDKWFNVNRTPAADTFSAYQRVDRETRAFIVSGVATTLRNASTTAIMGGMDVGARLIDGYVFAPFKAANRESLTGQKFQYDHGEIVRDALGMFAGIADRDFSMQVVEATLGNNPRLLNQIQRSLTDIGEGELSKAARVVNFLNTAHDSVVRRAVYADSLERNLKKTTGQTIAETMAKNGKIPTKIIQLAVDDALEATFADMPKSGLLKHFVRFQEAAGFGPGVLGAPLIGPSAALFGTTITAFPRFLASSVKMIHKYNLTGMGQQYAVMRKAKKAKAEGKIDDETYGLTIEKAQRDLAKGTIGTAALGAAIAYRAQNQETKYYLAKREDGSTVDLRPFFPLAPLLLIADAAVKGAGSLGKKIDIDLGDGRISQLSTADVAEGLFGIRMAGGAGFAKDMIQRTADPKAAAATLEDLGNSIGEFVNRMNTNLFSSFVRDFERQYDADQNIIRNTRIRESVDGMPLFWESFYTSATRGMPQTFRSAINEAIPGADPIPNVTDFPPLMLGTRDKPMRYQAPLQQQFTGMRITERRNFIESELDRLNIYSPFEYARSTRDALLTQYMREMMGDIVADMTLREDYDQLSRANQRVALMDAMRIARQDALAQAEDKMQKEDPERYAKMKYYMYPTDVRQAVNDDYAERNDGKTIEDNKDWDAGANEAYFKDRENE